MSVYEHFLKNVHKTDSPKRDQNIVSLGSAIIQSASWEGNWCRWYFSDESNVLFEKQPPSMLPVLSLSSTARGSLCNLCQQIYCSCCRIRFPFPFQYGGPTFNAGDAFAVMAAALVALIEVQCHSLNDWSYGNVSVRMITLSERCLQKSDKSSFFFSFHSAVNSDIYRSIKICKRYTNATLSTEPWGRLAGKVNSVPLQSSTLYIVMF